VDGLPGASALDAGRDRAVLALGVFGTGLAFLVFYVLIERVGATNATMTTYLIPLVAVVAGALVLDERLAFTALAGGALIGVGIWLSQRSSPRASSSWSRRPIPERLAAATSHAVATTRKRSAARPAGKPGHVGVVVEPVRGPAPRSRRGRELAHVAAHGRELGVEVVGDVDAWSAPGPPNSHSCATTCGSSPSSASSCGKAKGLRASG
jgi:hypothetical protein